MQDNLICGVDEAGRGPLAGPVYAAAVILGPNFNREGLRDSKKLSESKRYFLAEHIKKNALAWSVGICSAVEIDELNIHQATLLAMQRAIHALSGFSSIKIMVLEIFLYGFISAFGWWTANHYVIEPHFPPPIERKKDDQPDGKNRVLDVQKGS